MGPGVLVAVPAAGLAVLFVARAQRLDLRACSQVWDFSPSIPSYASQTFVLPRAVGGRCYREQELAMLGASLSFLPF